jgi:hypothetical protein
MSGADGNGEAGLPTHYWLLSLPIEGKLAKGNEGADQVLSVLKEKAAEYGSTYKARLLRSRRRVAGDATASFPLTCASQFALPELRVGTLDSLLTLSDELGKTATLVEGVAAKIRRQLGELNRDSAEVRRPHAQRAASAQAGGHWASPNRLAGGCGVKLTTSAS